VLLEGTSSKERFLLTFPPPIQQNQQEAQGPGAQLTGADRGGETWFWNEFSCTQWICMAIVAFSIKLFWRGTKQAALISSESVVSDGMIQYDCPLKHWMDAGGIWLRTSYYGLPWTWKGFIWKYLKYLTRCRMSDCNCKLTGSTD
jgi:hypothetical protein